ncbi:unnamed protein product [Urochloa humidicola]
MRTKKRMPFTSTFLCGGQVQCGVERLKLMCEAKLCDHVSAGTAATTTILRLAEQHQRHGLRKACLDILTSATNRKAFVSGEGFDDLCRTCPSIVKDMIVAGSKPNTLS